MTVQYLLRRTYKVQKGDNVLIHEAIPAVLLHRVGDRRGEIVRNGAFDGLVAEAADAIEFRLLEPVEQKLKVLVAFAGKAHDECGADGEVGTDFAPTRDPLQGLFLRCRPLHDRHRPGRCALPARA